MTAIQEWLVLGTVQVGLPYGRRSGLKSMDDSEAFAIFDAAWALGIRCFDVAEAYGMAIGRLAGWLAARQGAGQAHVVTKVRIDDTNALPSRLEAALGPFRGMASLTLLTHGAAGDDLWAWVVARSREIGASVGQSVYTPDEVSAAAEAPGIARIQAPGNLFDRRSLEARGDRSVPLDLRSAYLQGVLLEPPEAAEARAPGAGAIAGAVQAVANDVGLPASSLLLAVVLRRLRAGDRIVVGVDAPGELAPILQAAQLPSSAVAAFEEQVFARVPAPTDPRTLDPRRWPGGAEPGSIRS